MTYLKKRSSTLFSILIITLLLSCEEKNQKPDCRLILCDYVPLLIKVKFIDRNTNKDLLFEAGSNYSIRDIKIIPSVPREYLPIINLDSTNGKAINIENLVSGDSIKLGNLPADAITFNTKKASEEVCCSLIEITKLSINNTIVCDPCNDSSDRTIIVKK